MQFGPGGFPQLFEVLVHLVLDGHDLLNVVDVVFPGLRQRNGVGAAVKQGNAQFLLHLFHRGAQPWLGYEQLLCRL